MAKPSAVLLLLLFLSPSCLKADGFDWRVVNNFGDSIFTSYEISTSTLSANQKLSSHRQSLLVRIVAPASQLKCEIAVSQNRFLHESKTQEVFSKSGVHFIPLNLVWDFDALYSVFEPRPETFTFRIWVNGQLAGERSITYQMRSINDCLLSFEEPLSKRVNSVREMFAAYVDENDPSIDKIFRDVP